MARAGLPLGTGLLHGRWLRWCVGALAGPLLSLGCATTPIAQLTAPGASDTVPVLDHSYRPTVPSGLQQTAYHSPADLPPAGPPVDPALKPVPGKPMPVDLDGVLQLADEHNPQIAQARAKVEEGLLEKEDARTSCQLPWNKMAREIEADIKFWQYKVELSRKRQEVLLDAANTFFDLVTVRRVYAITQDMISRAEPMLKRAEDLQKTDPSASVLYEGVRAEVIGREQALAKVKQQGDALLAKLVSLLGLPCDAILVPVEPPPGLINRVDVSVPVGKLVEQSLATGPAIQETRGLLAALQHGHARAESWLCLLPQKKANLKRALARTRELQIELAIKDIAAKLAAGVQEARDAILLGREQYELGQQQIKHSEESYRLSELRVRENAPNARISDVMQAIRGLEQTQHEYQSAISSHNKAQIRLLLLLGLPPEKASPPPLPHH